MIRRRDFPFLTRPATSLTTADSSRIFMWELTRKVHTELHSQDAAVQTSLISWLSKPSLLGKSTSHLQFRFGGKSSRNQPLTKSLTAECPEMILGRKPDRTSKTTSTQHNEMLGLRMICLRSHPFRKDLKSNSTPNQMSMQGGFSARLPVDPSKWKPLDPYKGLALAPPAPKGKQSEENGTCLGITSLPRSEACAPWPSFRLSHLSRTSSLEIKSRNSKAEKGQLIQAGDPALIEQELWKPGEPRLWRFRHGKSKPGHQIQPKSKRKPHQPQNQGGPKEDKTKSSGKGTRQIWKPRWPQSPSPKHLRSNQPFTWASKIQVHTFELRCHIYINAFVICIILYVYLTIVSHRFSIAWDLLFVSSQAWLWRSPRLPTKL